jgi:hypothetical protein
VIRTDRPKVTAWSLTAIDTFVGSLATDTVSFASAESTVAVASKRAW